jgi:Transposase domain (DUF772)
MLVGRRLTRSPVKLMLVSALEGIGPTRELLRQAGTRLGLRRFLGYRLSERLPVHQTLSHAHTRRFVDAALFERLFVRSLELCKQHGLVEGDAHLNRRLSCGGGRGSGESASEPRGRGCSGGRP